MNQKALKRFDMKQPPMRTAWYLRPLTIPFYESCGFIRHHVIPGFFTDNYDHPIFEGGVQLKDMVCLRMPL